MAKYLLILALISSLAASAQRPSNQTKLVHYALDSFQNATVKLKSGQRYTQKMNYNLVTKEMIFEQNGKYLAVANPASVDTVYFGSRRFVPGEKMFYEYLAGTTAPLLLEYTCTIKTPGANTGYGTSNTAAVTSYNALLTSGAAYELKLPDDFQVIPGRAFIIRRNGESSKFSNESQFTRIFADKKDQIKTFLSEHKTSFSKAEDLIPLVQQLQ
jgi:hypothetical protein